MPVNKVAVTVEQSTRCFSAASCYWPSRHPKSQVTALSRDTLGLAADGDDNKLMAAGSYDD